MKRVLRYLPLLGLAPLVYFVGSYLDGAGLIPHGSSLFVSGFSMLILPWVVSIVFVKFAKTLPSQILLFICTLVAQPALIIAFVPPSVAAVTMGYAHRLRHEFPPDQLRECAGQLRQKLHAGTLVVDEKIGNDCYFIESPSSVLVADVNLPASLRGRFQRIFIEKNQDTGDEQVVFALGKEIGIMCDSRKDLHGFYVYSMADGVHAYRHERL
jgi:hypothetical protein